MAWTDKQLGGQEISLEHFVFASPKASGKTDDDYVPALPRLNDTKLCLHNVLQHVSDYKDLTNWKNYQKKTQ